MSAMAATPVCLARLERPARPGNGPAWAFVQLPREVSNTLPRRGRVTVAGQIDGHPFQATLEPDGQLGHWLRVDGELLAALAGKLGRELELALAPLAEEPDPVVPDDLAAALAEDAEASATWLATTALARLDWIHWIESARQARTRTKRVAEACDKLRSGQRRVCCFDPSGFYSKAFRPPEAADRDPGQTA